MRLIGNIYVLFCLGNVLFPFVAYAHADDGRTGDNARSVQQAAAEATQESLIEALIKQLGSDNFDERQAATQRLLEIGTPALSVLNRYRHADESEVSMQVVRISRLIVRQSLDRQIKLFLSDRDGSLPGWEPFQRIYGDHDANRQLFARLFRDRHKSIQMVEGRSASLTEEIQNLLMELNSRRSNQLKEDGELVATVAFLFGTFFLPDETSGQVADRLPSQIQFEVADLLDAIEVESIVKRDVVAAVIARTIDLWVASPDGNTLVAPTRLNKGRARNLESALVPAITCIQAADMANRHRIEAIDTIARLGDRSHYDLLEPLLDDETVLYRKQRLDDQGERVEFETQVRDHALSALVRIARQPFADFGFHLESQKPAPLVLPFRLAGFSSDETRRGAIERWRAFRAADH